MEISIKPKDFWIKNEINHDKIFNAWESKIKNEIKDFLNRMNEEELILVMNFFNLKKETQTKEEMISSILKLKEAYILGLLKDFHDSKIKSIREYCTQEPILSLMEAKELNKTFLSLLKVYKLDPTHLFGILTMHYWNRHGIGEKFDSLQKLEEIDIDKIKNNLGKITQYLTKKDKKGYKFKYVYGYKKDGNYYFFIWKQTGDRIKPDMGGYKRLRPVSEVLFRINLQDNTIEIKCKSEKIKEYLIKSFEYKCKLLFEKEQKTVSEYFKPEEFIKKIEATAQNTEQIDNEIRIVDIDFDKTKLHSSVPLKIKEKLSTDILPAILELHNFGIVDFSFMPLFVNKMIFHFNGKMVNIQRFINSDTSYELKITSGGINKEEKELINKSFERQFSIKLDTPLDLSAITTDRVERIENIMSGFVDTNPKEFIKNEIDNLQKKHLILTRIEGRFYCEKCSKRFTAKIDSIKCPDCENPIMLIAHIYKIKNNLPNIKKYVINLLNNEHITKTREIRRTFGNKKYKLTELNFNGKKVYLHLSELNISKGLIKYLMRSSLPLLIVQISRTSSYESLDDSLFSLDKFSNIFVHNESGNLENDHFTKLIEKKLDYSQSRISENSRYSLQNMELFMKGEKGYSDQELEDDTFNVIKQIFNFSEKWGKELSGKTVPEGIGTSFYEKNQQKIRKAFIWDCKFTQSAYYNFDRKTIDRSRRYISIMRNSDDVKQFSKTLNGFMTICNRIDEENFDHFASKLLSTRTRWKGCITLIDFDALYEIGHLYNKNYNQIKTRENKFYELLTNLLMKRNPRINFKHIKTNDIENLFNKLLESKSQIVPPNTDNIKKSFEEDKY